LKYQIKKLPIFIGIKLSIGLVRQLAKETGTASLKLFFLINSIFYEDYHENYYHGLMVGILSGIDDQNYIVESNRETGRGRSDILLKRTSFGMDYAFTRKHAL